jgi:hypothetical protein
VLSLAAVVSAAVGGLVFGVLGPASVAQADDNTAVCSRVSDYNTPLRNVLDTQANQINTLTQAGDINGAMAVAKQLAGSLQAWSTQVQQAAASASDPSLKAALTAAANDAQQLSQQLMAYNGTHNISLDQFGNDNKTINSICGFTTVAPSSPGVPSGGPSVMPS